MLIYSFRLLKALASLRLNDPLRGVKIVEFISARNEIDMWMMALRRNYEGADKDRKALAIVGRFLMHRNTWKIWSDECQRNKSSEIQKKKKTSKG